MTKIDCKVPFPKAGKGAFLLFTLADIAFLEELYGVGDYFDHIERGMNQASAKVTMDCLRQALRGPDGNRLTLDFDSDLPFTIDEAGMPIMDAVCLATSGMTYEGLIKKALERKAEVEKAYKEATDEGADPLATSVALSELRQSVISQG